MIVGHRRVYEMKVSFHWLKQYVDFSWSPEELAERLTLLGLEVEAAHKKTGDFENIVVAQVITRDPHPNANRLSLCRVNDGNGERQIVCGAQNFGPGDKVPLALPGAVMPTAPGEPPFVIKVGKIRGSESHGMMCSAKELGLAGDAEGLMILPATAVVGQPLATHLGRPSADVVYDLEITPNRPDWNGVIGIAREISALLGTPLRLPDTRVAPDAESAAASEWVEVDIQDAQLCPRYIARVLQGVRIGPSPDWLRALLEKVGLRSINNVVDVTNFVMLETGQPLHAFDYRKLFRQGNARPRIVIRRAAPGESFTTLDGQSRACTESTLLIADQERGIALAGIMGGQNTEIGSESADILLESAYFNPQNIRATSKALGLKTDASYRFERGADPEMADWASRRAASLIVQLGGGRLLSGEVDAYPTPIARKQITLRHSLSKQILGIEVTPTEQARYLSGLGIEAVEHLEGKTAFQIPSFRVDVKREHDLVEEIGRLYGIDRIPSTPPRGCIGTHAYDAHHDRLSEVRRILTAQGLSEAQGQTLISDSAAKRIAAADRLVFLAYPLSSDMNVLRPSLLPGLLDSLRHNANRQNSDVALFEIGRVFLKAGEQIQEERRLALAMTGARALRYWSGAERDAKCDVFDLKGLLEDLLGQLGLRGVGYAKREGEGGELFIESATLQLGKLSLGEFGQISPLLAKRLDLKDAVFVAELNIDMVLAKGNASRSYKPLPAFPSIRRDVAMLVAESVTHDAILNAIRQAKPANLELVELFDVFRGKGVPEGQKSMAYAFTYRATDRTLTDTEVNAAHEKVVAHFQQSLHASIRA